MRGPRYDLKQKIEDLFEEEDEMWLSWDRIRESIRGTVSI